MLLVINVIFYTMALAPFRMATSELPQRYCQEGGGSTVLTVRVRYIIKATLV